MRRIGSVALCMVVLFTWLGRPRPADALAVKVGEIVAGVAFEKTVAHLERCRKLPAASKGALSQGLNVMRRTPNGWAKAFIGAGALYWAWQQAKQGYIDEQAAIAPPTPPAGATYEKSGGIWIINIPAHPTQTHLLTVLDRNGVATGATHWLAAGNYTYPFAVDGGNRVTREGGDPWGLVATYGPMPEVFEPGEQLEDENPKLDNMTNNPNWRNRYKQELEEVLDEETAVTPNVEVPTAPYIWQKPGTPGTEPDDWVISEPQPDGEYASPEAGGDTGVGTSPGGEPTPQPTGEPSPGPTGEPTPQPSATPTPDPIRPPMATGPDAPNFIVHFFQGLQGKFPFDLVADAGQLPSHQNVDLRLTVFGYEFDLNFIKPFFTTLQVVGTIALTVAVLIAL